VGVTGENFTTQSKIRTKLAKICPDKNALEPNRVPDGLSGVLIAHIFDDYIHLHSTIHNNI
jgi:hypothetical protein